MIVLTSTVGSSYGASVEMPVRGHSAAIPKRGSKKSSVKKEVNKISFKSQQSRQTNLLKKRSRKHKVKKSNKSSKKGIAFVLFVGGVGLGYYYYQQPNPIGGGAGGGTPGPIAPHQVDEEALFDSICNGTCTVKVRKPSADWNNDFADIEFGKEEKTFNATLGALPLTDVNFDDYEVNPDLIKKVIGPTIDLSGYDNQFATTQARLKDIFNRLNFPVDTKFYAKEKKDDTDMRAYTKSEALALLDSFATQMENKQNLDDDTKKLFNYVIDHINQMNLGEWCIEDSDLLDDVKKNRHAIRDLMYEILTVRIECHAITTSFLERAIGVVDTESFKPITFPVKVYWEFQKYIDRSLERSARDFILKRYVKNRKGTKKQAIAEWKYYKSEQHKINGLKIATKKYIGFTGQENITDKFYSMLSFTGDEAKQDEVLEMFLQYFYGTCMTKEKVFGVLKTAIKSSYSGVPAKSYHDFATSKGLDVADLYTDDTYMELDDKKLLNILYNVKVFREKPV